jgi:hypothetical protein
MSAFNGHLAPNLLDNNPSSYWQIASFINQWVVFDLNSAKLLSRVELKKTRAGGFKDALLMVGPSVHGPWKTAAELTVPRDCKSFVLNIKPTPSRFWKFLVRIIDHILIHLASHVS